MSKYILKNERLWRTKNNHKALKTTLFHKIILLVLEYISCYKYKYKETECFKIFI